MAAAGGARPREVIPPPIIGKAGRYTVFITPPATPKTPYQTSRPSATPTSASPSSIPTATPVPKSDAHMSLAKAASPTIPAKVVALSPPPPPVQVPPPQFGKASSRSSNSTFGFVWDTVAKFQDAHSRLDEYLADWFGLNQSKYQWALNDYYESKGLDKDGRKTDDRAHKCQSV